MHYETLLTHVYQMNTMSLQMRYGDSFANALLWCRNYTSDIGRVGLPEDTRLCKCDDGTYGAALSSGIHPSCDNVSKLYNMQAKLCKADSSLVGLIPSFHAAQLRANEIKYTLTFPKQVRCDQSF